MLSLTFIISYVLLKLELEGSILNLEKHIGNSDCYSELRVQEVSNHSIRMVNSSIRENRKGVSSGASARSFLQRNWGFASSPNQDSVNLDILADRSCRIGSTTHEKAGIL